MTEKYSVNYQLGDIPPEENIKAIIEWLKEVSPKEEKDEQEQSSNKQSPDRSTYTEE